jgi:hypothetical protein
VDAVLAVLAKNVTGARATVTELARNVPSRDESPASRALASAIVTSRDSMPASARAKLEWLLKGSLP